MSIINIFCDKASTQAIKIFKKSGFKIESELDKSEILWIRKNFKEYLTDMHDNQIINHLPSESQITTKGNLTKNLKEKDNKVNKVAVDSHSNKSSNKKKKKHKNNHETQSILTQTQKKKFCSENFYKESYCLSDKEDVLNFFNNTRERNKELWILKPSSLSKGCGVRIIEDLVDLKDVIINKDKAEYLDRYQDYFYYEDEEEDFIIQRHIDNPLLLNKKKSEIRVYWFVLSADPLSVVIYNDATVRLCSEDYVAGDYSNPLKHITNVYQQKQFSDNFVGQDLKWSLDMMRQDVLAQGLTNNQNFLEEELFPQIRKAITYIITAAQHNLFKSKTYKQCEHLSPFNFFGLYGCDIMIDNNLQPWILEVQKGPGLSFDHQHKANVLLPMIENGIQSVHRYKYQDDSMFDLPKGYSWLVYKNKVIEKL